MKEKKYLQFSKDELEKGSTQFESSSEVSKQKCDAFLNFVQQEISKKMLEVQEYQEEGFTDCVISLFKKMNLEEKELFFGSVECLLESSMFLEENYQILLEGVSITRSYPKLQNIQNLLQQRKAAEQYIHSFVQLYLKLCTFSSILPQMDRKEEEYSSISSFNVRQQSKLDHSRQKILTLAKQYIKK